VACDENFTSTTIAPAVIECASHQLPLPQDRYAHPRSGTNLHLDKYRPDTGSMDRTWALWIFYSIRFDSEPGMPLDPPLFFDSIRFRARHATRRTSLLRFDSIQSPACHFAIGPACARPFRLDSTLNLVLIRSPPSRLSVDGLPPIRHVHICRHFPSLPSGGSHRKAGQHSSKTPRLANYVGPTHFTCDSTTPSFRSSSG
jgi:hypothetical protein